MSLKITTAGALKLMDKLLTAYGNTLVLHLFKNNYTPVDGTLLSDLTEANFTGYATQTITSWGAATTVSGRATAVAATNTFTAGTVGTGNDIYGYYVTDSGGNLLWAERDLNAPVNMNVTGYTCSVAPTLTDKSEF